MMQYMVIGQYVPGNSIMHRLDPRAKLFMVFVFVFIVFIANNPLTYTMLGLFTIASIIFSKVPTSFILKGLRPILWIILFTMVLHLLMTKEGDVLYDFGWFKIYEDGVKQAVFISLRFLFLIMMTSLLTLTTTPIEITDGMESMLAPLKRVGFPVHELALMMSIALRFIPTLMQETEKLIKAQTARGVDFRSGPWKDRIQAIVSLLVPLFISAFKRAEELALAMEARGYHGGEGRTKLRELKWGMRDTTLLALLALLTVLLFSFRTYGG